MTTKQQESRITEIQKSLFYVALACGIAFFILKVDEVKEGLDTSYKLIRMLNLIIGWLCFILSGREAWKNRQKATTFIKDKVDGIKNLDKEENEKNN